MRIKERFESWFGKMGSMNYEKRIFITITVICVIRVECIIGYF